MGENLTTPDINPCLDTIAGLVKKMDEALLKHWAGVYNTILIRKTLDEWAHDLDDECTCDTCEEVRQITRAYK